ncbi:MAG: hypothetical protein ACRDZO_26885 [Egibacteraceae bacterium]
MESDPGRVTPVFQPNGAFVRGGCVEDVRGVPHVAVQRPITLDGINCFAQPLDEGLTGVRMRSTSSEAFRTAPTSCGTHRRL